MMPVYRIVRKRYETDVLSGAGGRKVASRWNYKGDPIVYTSGTRALSLLEMLVHMDMEDMRRMNLMMCEVLIPDDLKIQTIATRSLPEDWNNVPFSDGTQAYWRNFIQKKKAPILRVPSVIIPQEWNYLINPSHPESEKIKVKACTSLQVDERY